MGSPKIREYRSSRKHRADEIVLNELIAIHAITRLQSSECVESIEGALNLISEFFTDIFSPYRLRILIVATIQRYDVQKVKIIVTQQQRVSVKQAIFKLTVKLHSAILRL